MRTEKLTSFFFSFLFLFFLGCSEVSRDWTVRNASPDSQLNASHGNAIIAELLRLAEHIPEPFRLSSTRFSAVVMDMKYFQKDDWYEEKIHDSAELLDLDNEFRDNHLEILNRFYQVFEVRDFLLFPGLI